MIMIDVVLKFDVDTLFMVASSLKEYVNEAFVHTGYIVSTQMHPEIWNKLSEDASVKIKYNVEDPTVLQIYSDSTGELKLIMTYDTQTHEFGTE